MVELISRSIYVEEKKNHASDVSLKNLFPLFVPTYEKMLVLFPIGILEWHEHPDRKPFFIELPKHVDPIFLSTTPRIPNFRAVARH